LSEAEAKASELKSTLEGYESARKALDECAKSTNEWNEALATANAEALKLLELYPLIETLLEKGNKNVYSDALISAILCHSAIESALCNVVVNRNLLNGVETKDRLDKKIKEILSKSTETKNRILKSSNRNIKHKRIL
jgi:formiminotetrahydrofolate cyclodeaminase